MEVLAALPLPAVDAALALDAAYLDLLAGLPLLAAAARFLPLPLPLQPKFPFRFTLKT